MFFVISFAENFLVECLKILSIVLWSKHFYFFRTKIKLKHDSFLNISYKTYLVVVYMVATLSGMSGKSGKIRKNKKKDKSPEKSGENGGF